MVDNLESMKVTIAGIGLMGGSLALALRWHCATLTAYDPDPDTIAFATDHKIVDEASTNFKDIIHGSNLIILAAPLRAILSMLNELPGLNPGNAIILDIGSIKTAVVDAMQLLPERFDPIGGHPICGKETSSIRNADPDLFRNQPFVLTPLKRTTSNAEQIAIQVIDAIGAFPIFLDPEVHDRWVAFTSHFPYLVACILASSTPSETAALVGPGFRSTTRIAGSAPSIMADILSINRKNILNALDQYQAYLDRFRDILEKEDLNALVHMLEQSNLHHKNLLEKSDQKVKP
jgi:prephenate dehydrogenase